MLRPCRFASDFSRPRHGPAGARHGVCELTSAVSRQPMSDLPGSISSDCHAESQDWPFGIFRLHANFHGGHGTVGGRQAHRQVPSNHQSWSSPILCFALARFDDGRLPRVLAWPPLRAPNSLALAETSGAAILLFFSVGTFVVTCQKKNAWNRSSIWALLKARSPCCGNLLATGCTTPQ